MKTIKLLLATLLICSTQSINSQVFTASQDLNDASVELDWSYPVDPCLLNNSMAQYQCNGINPCIELELKADGATIFSQDYNDLSSFYGPEQAPLNFVTEITDSSGGYAYDFSSDPVMQMTDDYTIELWMRSTTASAILAKEISPNIQIELDNHAGINVTQNGSVIGSIAFDPIAMDVWHHYAFVANNLGQTLVYINGIYIGAINYKINLQNYKTFGGSPTSYLGSVRIWDRVRNTTEIANNYLIDIGTQANLIVLLKHANGSSFMTDFGMSDGIAQNFTFDPSYGNVIAFNPSPQYQNLEGSFHHVVGPNKSINYELILKVEPFFSQEPDCGLALATGTTLPFQQVTNIQISNDKIDRIILKWTNNSSVTDKYTIKRNGQTVLTIDTIINVGDTFEINDQYLFDEPLSISNGVSYTYTIETFNNLNNETYSQNSPNGSTVPINLEATDIAQGLTDKIQLNWSDTIKNFGDRIDIHRDGSYLTSLSIQDDQYTDFGPTYGLPNEYELYLYQNNERIIKVEDQGSIPPNGVIKGRVITQVGNYPIPNVQVTAIGVEGASMQTATTDALGNFEIQNLTYGLIDSFNLTAILSGHNIVPLDSNIILTKNQPIKENIILIDLLELTEDNNAVVNINSFTASPMPAEDKVNLQWSANASTNNVFVEIKRNEALIYTATGIANLNSSYEDLNGIPGSENKYTIRVFTLQNDMVKVLSQGINTTFPEVAMLPNNQFFAPVNPLGYLDLNWFHSSQNIAYYNIYRNGNLLTKANQSLTYFKDSLIVFDTDLVYEIAPVRTVDGIDFEAKSRTTANPSPVNLGSLGIPINVVATTNPITPSASLTWEAPAGLNLDYNFTGYKIYRGMELIEVVFKDRTLEIEDRDGFVLSGPFAYGVSTFLMKADGTEEESAIQMSNVITYPDLPIPPPLIVNTQLETIVQIVNDSLLPPEVNNYDGMHFFKNGVYINSAIDNIPYLLDNNEVSGPITVEYSVRTYRRINNQLYYSEPWAVDVNFNLVESGLPAPMNVLATNDLPNHTKICWDYPDNPKAKFRIFREPDGQQIDTLEVGTRAFYDYSIPSQGVGYFYKIQALLEDPVLDTIYKSRFAIVPADIIEKKTIYGKVVQKDSQKGVPNVKIQLRNSVNFSGNGYESIGCIQQIRTDSSGFFMMEHDFNFGHIPDFQLYLKAESPNADFVVDSIPVLYMANSRSCEIIFEDTYVRPEMVNGNSVQHLTAVADTLNLNMHVNYNADPNDFTEIEINKGLNEIARINNFSPMGIIDSTVAPGVTYNYGVRAINSGTDNRSFSAYKITEATLPKLEAVINLTATALVSKNQVHIQWSHKYDNATYYAVLRNGELMEKVYTGSPFQHFDKTGAPGNDYTYTVFAVKENEGGSFVSDPKSVSITFPRIQEPIGVKLSIPLAENVPILADSSKIDNAYIQNHIAIQWEYFDADVDAFKIYRNDVLLATVADSLRTFRDYSGLPNSNTNYKVGVAKIIEGTEREEISINQSITFPVLAKPSHLEVYTRDTLADVVVRFQYDQGADGFYIYRSTDSTFQLTDRIDTIAMTLDSVQQYYDKKGEREVDYYYGVEAFSKRESVPEPFKSPLTLFPNLTTYPKLPAPYNFVRNIEEFIGGTEFTWEYPTEFDIIQYQIERRFPDLSTVAETFWIDGTNRSFTDFIEDSPPTSSVWRYFVRAVDSNQDTSFYGQTLGSPATENDGTFEFLTQQTTEFFEPDVNAHKDFAITGDVYNRAAIILRYDSVFTRGWMHQQTFQNNDPLTSDRKYGHSVAIGENLAVIGAPQIADCNGTSAIEIYAFDGSLWTLDTTITSPDCYFGWDVAISGRTIVMTNIDVFGTNIEPDIIIYDDEDNNGTWEINIPSNPITLPSHLYGMSMDFDGTTIVVGAFNRTAPNGTKGMAFVYDISNGSFDFVQDIYYTPPSSAYGDFVSTGFNVAVDGDHIAVSAPNADVAPVVQPGVVMMYEKNNAGTFDEIQELFGIRYSTADFGANLDLDGDKLIVSNPYLFHGDDADINLFEFNGTNWDEIQLDREEFYDPGNGEGQNVNSTDKYPSHFGIGLALTEHHIFVTTRGNTIRDAGQDIPAPSLYIFDVEPYHVDSVVASDGGSLLHTQIEWEVEATPNAIAEFRIYRNAEHIATVSSADTTFVDKPSNLLPNAKAAITGVTYNYEIRVVPNNGYGIEDLKNGRSDTGFCLSNGKLEGHVYADGTTIGIKDVLVKCSALIGNYYYEFEALTNNSGKYTFENLPYLQSGTQYQFNLEYFDHPFELISPSSIPFLESTGTTHTGITFYDKLAYTLSGKVDQKFGACNLNDLKVVLCKTVDGTTIRADSTITVEGEYSFVINPLEQNVEKIGVLVENIQVLNEDSIRYNFEALGASSITDFSNVETNTFINFQDTLRYPVLVRLLTTCGIPISDKQYQIRVYSKDGCFDQIFTTSQSGAVNLRLPPLDYVLVANGVMNGGTEDLIAVDYLSQKPISLNIKALHESYGANMPPTIEDQILVFHKNANLSLTNSTFDRYLCDDNSQAAIVNQTNGYTLDFNVTEQFDAGSCAVNEGYLLIQNSAATNPGVQRVDYTNGGFPAYTFIAGSPNLIAPHLYNLKVDYYSNANDLLASYSKEIIVEGETSLPGANVIVNPTDDQNGGFKVPLYVLRDPPGDASYSEISTGNSISKSIVFDTTSSYSSGIYTDGNVLLGLGLLGGLFWEIDARWGFADEKRNSFNVDLSTTTTYRTSDDETGVGRLADVIIGAGYSTQYGLVQSIRVADCDSIAKETKIAFGLGSLATDWQYSVRTIEQLIRDGVQDSVLIELGLKQYYFTDVNGAQKPYSKTAARAKVSSLIKSWRDILYYHDYTALPHVAFCTTTNADLDPTVLLAKPQISIWRNAFCNEIGSFGAHNSFTLDEQVIWDQPLITKYNNTVAAVEALKGLIAFEAVPGDLIFNASGNFIDPNYGIASNYNTLLGTDIKSAQTLAYDGNQGPTTRKVTTQQTTGVDYSMASFHEVTSKSGLAFSYQSSASTGVGFELEQQTSDIDVHIGWSHQSDSREEISLAKANANFSEITYHLDDNDIDDNGVVTVLQGPLQNHSPYFMWFGGQTSCPVETANTIGNDVDPVAIDNPFIGVINPNTGAVIASGEEGGSPFAPPAYNVDPLGVAVFDIQIANNSPTTLKRNLTVFLDPLSNPNNAVITLGGQTLGSITYDSLLSQNSFPTPSPNQLQLEIKRSNINSPNYDFENIKIGIKPECGGPTKYIYLSAHFQSPCSPISLTNPENGFVVRRENVNDPNDREEIIFELRDYQSGNSSLDEIEIQYRRLGTGLGWETVPGGFVSRAQLAVSDAMLAATQAPVYYFIWDITGAYDLYPDGDYELRAIAICNSGSNRISNVTTGKISRTQVLAGNTEPADGIWTMNDEISIAFSQNMDCGLINTPSFIDTNLILIDTTTGLEVPFDIICLNNKITFLPQENMSTYDGHTLMATAKNVQTIDGNFAMEDTWYFKVLTQQVDYTQELIEVYMYQGSQLSVKTPLINSTGFFINGITTEQTTSSAWLTIDPMGSFNVPIDGLELTLNFDASLAIGIYEDSIKLQGLTGRTPVLPIRMHVLQAPPDIPVNNNYSDSMEMVINWRYNYETALSTDTMDQIQVYVNNELRGLGRIQQTGDFYHTTLKIKGDPSENGTSLDFQVWNNDDTQLYDGLHVPFDAVYTSNARLGTIYEPEVLIVEGDPILRKRIYVDSSQVGNIENGLTWPTAFEKLEDALLIASPFDTIWIARGNYFPTNGSDRSTAYNVNTELIILGGFISGQSSPLQRTGIDSTFLSGDLGVKDQDFDNSYHLIKSNVNYLLMDGLHLKDANANGSGLDQAGAAIDNEGTLTLRNGSIRNCNGIQNGSVIRNEGSDAQMILENISIQSTSSNAWILNANGAMMTVIGLVEMKE